MTKHVPPPSGEPVAAPEAFAALAAAVSPAWHQAIIRLANSTERVAFRLEAFMGASMETGFVPCARDLARALIDFLDELVDLRADASDHFVAPLRKPELRPGVLEPGVLARSDEPVDLVL